MKTPTKEEALNELKKAYYNAPKTGHLEFKRALNVVHNYITSVNESKKDEEIANLKKSLKESNKFIDILRNHECNLYTIQKGKPICLTCNREIK